MQEIYKHLLLLLTKPARLKPGRLERLQFPHIGRQDIARCFVAYQRLGALLVIKRFGKGTCKVFFGCKCAKPFPWAKQDLGRVRSEERRGRRDTLPRPYREVD